MRQNAGSSAVKEVEYAVVDSPEARPEFVDGIAQVIGIRSAYLVANLTQSLDPAQAFGEGSRLALLNLFEPVKDRNPPLGVLIEDDLNGRHPSSPIYINIGM
jgi:hypothetical protein